jgi:hypothetical protein
MTLSRVFFVMALALGLALPTVQAQTFGVTDGLNRQQDTDLKAAPLVCKIYSLADLGDDPNLGPWLAATIPTVIQPEYWTKESPVKDCTATAAASLGRLNYFPPGKILVVYHTAAVQAEVAAFLQNVKQALPRGNNAAARTQQNASGIKQVLFPIKDSATAVIKTAEAAPASKYTYPIPAPVKQPKHLFHLIIRYEGEGLGDVSALTDMLQNASGVQVTTGKTEEKKEGDNKDGPAAAKPAKVNQAFNLILRYEGEGIIDRNVAGLLKEIYGQKAGQQQPPTTCCPPAASPNCPVGPGPLPSLVPSTKPPNPPPSNGSGVSSY